MHGQTSDNTPKHAKECAEGLKGKSLAAAKRDFPVRVSAELEQEMISCSSCSISKRPISRDVSATFGKMEVASQRVPQTICRRRPHLVLKQTLHACPYQKKPPCMPLSMRLTEREYARVSGTRQAK